MPLDEDALIKSRSEIVAAMVAEWQAAVPDIWLGQDGVLRNLIEIEAGQLESLYLANHILREDMFIQTASVQALEFYGDMFGVPRKGGAQALGDLLFSGDPGTYIPVGAEVAYDPGTGEESMLVYETTVDGSIPAPGTPSAPTPTDSGVAGVLNGTYEYAVSFVTAAGETLIGSISSTVSVTNRQVTVSNIPVGGAGTTQRRLYRRLVGGTFKRVTTLNDNIATVYTDNIAEGSLGAEPLATPTAFSISLASIAEEPGVDYNVVSNSITQLNDVPDGITGVSNPNPFTGGTDEEDIEAYRTRLLNFIRDPETGSPSDIERWAEEVEGVEDATAFPNDNLGVATNGHVTVRVSGPGGSVPPQSVLDAVLAAIEERDMANVTVHVAAFTQVPTDVTVDVTVDTDFTLSQVTPSVETAIEDYINDLAVGGTLYIAGIIDAVFGLSGITNVTVTTPATDLTTAATQKRSPGTITVT